MFERVDSNSSLRDYLSQVKRGLEGAELSSRIKRVLLIRTPISNLIASLILIKAILQKQDYR